MSGAGGRAAGRPGPAGRARRTGRAAAAWAAGRRVTG